VLHETIKSKQADSYWIMGPWEAKYVLSFSHRCCMGAIWTQIYNSVNTRV